MLRMQSCQLMSVDKVFRVFVVNRRLRDKVAPRRPIPEEFKLNWPTEDLRLSTHHDSLIISSLVFGGNNA